MVQNKTKFHKELAGYFEKRWNEPHRRALVELPWQLKKCGSTGQLRLESLYLDIIFFYYSVALRNAQALLNDLEFLSDTAAEHDFMKKFMQSYLFTLNADPRQFFNLLYHIGGAELKEQVRSKCFQAKSVEHLFVTEMIEIPDEIEEQSESCQIELSINKKMQLSKQSVIAKSPQWVFFFEKIGVLNGLDLNTGMELFISADLPVKRAESLYVSDDGRYLCTAYIDDKVLVYSLEHRQQDSRIFIEASQIHECTYKLPEFESPLFAFNGHILIYQNVEGTICRFHCQDKSVELMFSPVKQESELAAFDVNEQYSALGFREGRGGGVYIFKKHQLVAEQAFGEEIVCISFLSPSEIIVLLTGKKLQHFSISENKLIHIRSMELPERPHLCAGGHDQAVIFVLPNTMMIYDREGSLKPVSNLPENIGLPVYLTQLQTDEYAFTSSIFIAKYSMISGSKNRKREFVSILQNTVTGHHWIREKVKSTQRMIDVENSKIHPLIHRLQGFISEQLDAIDGQGNILHMWFEGGGEYYSLQRDKWIDISQMPEYPISVVGNTLKGFWVATQDGDIYFGGPEQGWQHVHREYEDIKGIGPLKLFDNLLIWEGIVIKAGEHGTDFKSKVTFLSCNLHTGKLNTVGSRIFKGHNGLLGPIAWNSNSKQLYFLLFSDKSEYQCARLGTVDEFINEGETLKPIYGLSERVLYCQKFIDSNLYYMLTKDGSLLVVDLDKFKVESALSPNQGMLKMVRNQILQNAMLVTDTSSDVYSCKLFRKDV